LGLAACPGSSRRTLCSRFLRHKALVSGDDRQRTPDHQQLADDLHRRASEGAAERLHHRSTNLAVIAQNPDLDQLMRGQCPIGLGNDPRCQTRITDHHYRVEVMGVGAQRTPRG